MRGRIATHLFCLALAGSFYLALSGSAQPDDVVVIATTADPAERQSKSGQILDYTGTELTLKTPFGTTERIPAGRIVEIQSTWTEPHEAGRTERLVGNLSEAISKLQQAQRDEKRVWAKRQIAAELSNTFLEAGRISDAVREFLPIVASDPATPHYNVAPVAWRAAAPDAAQDRLALTWLNDTPSELVRLIGASWLLPGGQRAAAIAALEQLVNSSDRRIAALAEMQLWRTKLISATPDDAKRWEARLETLPPEVQPGAWYILGEVSARQGNREAAALAYLKVPLLFREHRPLAADSLLGAAKQLEQLGRTAQAAGLYRELTRDFGHLPAADEGQTRLTRLAAETAETPGGNPPASDR